MVAQFKEVFLTPRYLGIAMEYASGGDMFEFFVRNKAFANGLGLAEDLARWFFQQLIIALDFTHKKGIANRDIKLEVRGPAVGFLWLDRVRPDFSLFPKKEIIDCASTLFVIINRLS